MMHSTAVAAKKEKNNDHNNSSETGIFVTHSPTKAFSKNNSINMFNNYNYSATFLTLCLLSLQYMQQCLATAATGYVDGFQLPTPPAPYECKSVDLRNSCNDFYKLNNCTVITGFLDMVKLPRNDPNCNFNEYQFKNLREITDFLLIGEVRNLSSIKNMFPNLSVIRGQQLFLNYALVITSVHDLEKLEFKSLIAIQRGHVLIDGNPKLCYTEKVNWARLSLTPGKDLILLDDKAQCPLEVKCSGCKRDSCWSNEVCQKIENDSVISLMQDTSECHEQCLGGCYNRTAQGCVVCKRYTNNGTCVQECPYDKYVSRHYLRCYTREECVNKKRRFIYKNECVDVCPSGYKLNTTTRECDSCGGLINCTKVCDAKNYESTIYISNIMQADALRGCEILNGVVVININNFFDQQELFDNLRDVKEIKGLLRIYRSPYITTLNFFQNLEKIHGEVLENKQYALIVYNNKNLTELWQVKRGFEIIKGGIYIHSNDKLCNRRIRQFRESVMHDNSLDSFQTSDQDVLCSPAKLNMYLEVLDHRSIKFYWFKNQTLAQVEIIYKPLSDKGLVTEKSELDTDVCDRIKWHRELKFPHELHGNSSHYTYIANNLEPHTRYACLVKTFNGEDDTQEARSEIRYATTQFDIPSAPTFSLKSKTFDTLQIEFSPAAVNSFGSQVVDFYLLEVYDMPDDKKMLDTRDFCDVPVSNYKDSVHEDYDDCCSRREEERKDELFLSELKKEFGCSLDKPAYCTQNYYEFNDTNDRQPIFKRRFEAWETNYILRSLERFHLYVLQVQACNHAGCSSSSLISTRTNYSTAADKIYDFSACKIPQSDGYRVSFSEPKLPNGYITSYALHFRYHNYSSDSDHDSRSEYHNYLVCITRLEHENNKYIYVAHSKYNFNEAAVRVNSLNHHTFMDWINVTTCPSSKYSGSTSKSWIIFIVLVLIAAAVFLLWISYKRRFWHSIPQVRRYLPLNIAWRHVGPPPVLTDRDILVSRFDSLHFRNSEDDDEKCLVYDEEE